MSTDVRGVAGSGPAAVVAPSPADEGAGRIGPNAVVQTLRAMAEAHGADAAERLALEARLPDHTWDRLIPETWFLRVIRALRSTLAPAEAEAVLRRAGALTGTYVREHRIPAPFRLALAALPSRWAVPLLLRAFRRHAWTFAGSGRFRVEGPRPGILVLEGAPTCRDPGTQERCGSYYEAAFETLLALAAPGIRVREVACRAGGDAACRFRLELPSHI